MSGLSQLRSKDLDCLGHGVQPRVIVVFIIMYCTALVKPEFNIHASARVSLQCLVSPQWIAASNAEYWWKKVLHTIH